MSSDDGTHTWYNRINHDFRWIHHIAYVWLEQHDIGIDGRIANLATSQDKGRIVEKRAQKDAAIT